MILASVTVPLVPKCVLKRSSVRCLGRFLIINLLVAFGLLGLPDGSYSDLLAITGELIAIT